MREFDDIPLKPQVDIEASDYLYVLHGTPSKQVSSTSRSSHRGHVYVRVAQARQGRTTPFPNSP